MTSSAYNLQLAEIYGLHLSTNLCTGFNQIDGGGSSVVDTSVDEYGDVEMISTAPDREFELHTLVCVILKNFVKICWFVLQNSGVNKIPHW